MITVKRRLPRFAIGGAVGHYAAGGPAGSYAQGLPSATPAAGYTPGPETNAVGSWGAAAQQGIPGDPSTVPTSAPLSGGFSNNAYIQQNTPGNYGSYQLKTKAPTQPKSYQQAIGELPASNLVESGGYGSQGNSGIAGSKGGAIPQFEDGGDVPAGGDYGAFQDGGQQQPDMMSVVRQAISASRQRYGLDDAAFQQFSNALAGNIPAKPAGPGGDQPDQNPFPTKTPNPPFGQRADAASDSDNADSGGDDESASAAEGGAIPMEAAHGGPPTKDAHKQRTKRKENLPAVAMGNTLGED